MRSPLFFTFSRTAALPIIEGQGKYSYPLSWMHHVIRGKTMEIDQMKPNITVRGPIFPEPVPIKQPTKA